VFDIGPDGTATVPVRPAQRVGAAKALAITQEPPGGMVVSRGPHLVVLTPTGRP
jgi:hypothetical protein